MFVTIQGAALGAMVGLLTFGNRKYEPLDPVMRVAIPPLHNASQQLIPLIDKDTQAFNSYMVCTCVYQCMWVRGFRYEGSV